MAYWLYQMTSVGISPLVFIWLFYRVGYADSFFHHIRDTVKFFI
jgi:hypothetical protein